MQAKHRVYRNLHKDCWSVQYKGIVVERPDSYVLRDVTFCVSDPGRQRVIQEKRKNVHAKVAGTPEHPGTLDAPERTSTDISYNPYRGPMFYAKDSGRNIVAADRVVFWPSGRVTAYGITYAPELEAGTEAMVSA